MKPQRSVLKKIIVIINKSFPDYFPDSRSVTPQRNVPAEDRVPADHRVPAEERLFSVRTELVTRLSDAVLNQLLDELLVKKIITQEEMNLVKTKHKEDKARDVIDMALSKGSETSLFLISAICEQDPWLAKRLNFS